MTSNVLYLENRYTNTPANKRVELFDERDINEPTTDDNVQMTSCKALYSCEIHKLVANYTSVHLEEFLPVEPVGLFLNFQLFFSSYQTPCFLRLPISS